MNRFQQRIQQIRKRNRIRYAEEVYHVDNELSRDLTDEIEKALWDIKDAMDIPTEEIDIAVDSRRRTKGGKNGRSI